MFPDIADDPAAHVLYTLKFVELVSWGASWERITVVNVG